jgi:hypothetical protein
LDAKPVLSEREEIRIGIIPAPQGSKLLRLSLKKLK